MRHAAINLEAAARDSSLMGASNKEGSVHHVRDKRKGKGKTSTKPDKLVIDVARRDMNLNSVDSTRLCATIVKTKDISRKHVDPERKPHPIPRSKRQSLRNKTMMMLTGCD